MSSNHTYFEKNLRLHLHRYAGAHSWNEIYEYSLLPAGKYFRPELVMAVAAENLSDKQRQEELSCPNSPLSLLASLVEIHHTYTLIHDDMPCMDNDDFRRGRLSTHKKYGEWQALLAGDGLHGLSYRLLSEIRHSNQALLLKLMAHCLGPKGLILGQAMDLSGEMNKDHQSLRKTHLLKTGRLIQFSLMASSLVTPNYSYKRTLRLASLGETLGIAFQFIDDLSELSEPVGDHELGVNPWLNDNGEVAQATYQFLLRLDQNLQGPLRVVFAHYLAKMNEKILGNEKEIREKLQSQKTHLEQLKLIHPLLVKLSALE